MIGHFPWRSCYVILTLQSKFSCDFEITSITGTMDRIPLDDLRDTVETRGDDDWTDCGCTTT